MKQLSAEQKEEILKRIAKGGKPADLAKEYEVHPTTIYKMKRNAPKKKAKDKPVAKSMPIVSDGGDLQRQITFWRSKYMEEHAKRLEAEMK
jgi:transposase-like protein